MNWREEILKESAQIGWAEDAEKSGPKAVRLKGYKAKKKKARKRSKLDRRRQR